MRTYLEVKGLPRNEYVIAPCCGRRVLADVLLHAHKMPLELRPRSAEFLCDGCRERLVNSGTLTREQLILLLHVDPPAHLIQKMRGIDRELRGDGVRQS